jgi:hypothetical protein
MRWIAAWILLGGVSLGLLGCAGYKLGPTTGIPAGARSIQVNPFQNQTVEPRLVESITGSLRRILQQDGSYRLATHGDGDVIVNGVILEYRRSPLSNQPNDLRTAQDYSISIKAKVTATERSTGRVLLDREVVGRSTVRSGEDFTSIQRQEIPLIAEDLARQTASLLVNGSW